MRGLKTIISFVILLASLEAYALPIGFGVNQGDLQYKRIKGPHFWIYHDARAPYEAAFAANLLEAIRPTMELWFAEKRDSALPVINSSVSSNASFANFITDVIEIQSLGHGPRDLFWHEYIHNMMYLHLSNILGPPGAVLHLLWMPAWFIEGLAEAFSVSVSSEVQASIERYSALTGKWPTFDRMHSLYQVGSFALRGYALSGSFIAWMLRENNPEKLPSILGDFWDYTLPWYWVWAAVPFNGFMPMDRTLQNYAGGDGEQLFYRYQKAAKEYWQKNRSRNGLLLDRKGKRSSFTSIASLHSRGDDAFTFFKDEDNGLIYRYKFKFDDKTGWATSTEKRGNPVPDYPGALTFAETKDYTVTVGTKRISPRRSYVYDQIVKLYNDSQKEVVVYRPSNAYINDVFLTDNKVAFQMRRFDKTNFCWFPRKLLNGKLPISSKKVSCRKFALPQTLTVLGAKSQSKSNGYISDEIWLSVETQTKTKDTYDILSWNAKTGKFTKIIANQRAKPISVSFENGNVWLLQSERTFRTIRKLTPKGQCKSVIKIDDMPLAMTALSDGKLVLSLYKGSSRNVIRIDPKKLKHDRCYIAYGHTSPMLETLRTGNKHIGQAFASASIWHQQKSPAKKAKPKSKNLKKKKAEIENNQQIHETAPFISNQSDTLSSKTHLSEIQLAQREKRDLLLAANNANKTANPTYQAKPSDTEDAPWYPRTVLPAVPWIGANDPISTQIGIISVPLMDHLQNETVRLTFLYGIDSRFPNTDLNFTSTRFWPTISLSAFRQQVWNGTWYSSSRRASFASYVEETGTIYSMTFPWRWRRQSISLATGTKVSEIKPYLGPWRVRSGTLVEPFANATYRYRFTKSTFSLALRSRFASEVITENFDYDQIGLYLNYSYSLPFWSSTLLSGVEGSRTRGMKRRLLKEYYRPLKTFVPGSGGGLNQNSFPVAGQGSLFTARYGENQARYKLNYTVPVIKDVDYFFWLFYFERLDFTAFLNYGGAWYGEEAPTEDVLVGAHGYSLDLQFENKGVGFNLGVGTGQVFEEEFQIYVTSGFDAIF